MATTEADTLTAQVLQSMASARSDDRERIPRLLETATGRAIDRLLASRLVRVDALLELMYSMFDIRGLRASVVSAFRAALPELGLPAKRRLARGLHVHMQSRGVRDDLASLIVDLFVSERGARLLRLKHEIDACGGDEGGAGELDLDHLVFELLPERERDRMLLHFRTDGRRWRAAVDARRLDQERRGVVGAVRVDRPVRVLSDVDDTFKCSLLDYSFPNHTRYPGVSTFYAAICHGQRRLTLGSHSSARPSRPPSFPVSPETGLVMPEPHLPERAGPTISRVRDPIYGDFDDDDDEDEDDEEYATREAGFGHVVFISARPKAMKASTNKMLVDAGAAATVTVLTGKWRNFWSSARMAKGKVEKFRRYILLFPECRFVWVGDSGQGDIEFARIARALCTRNRPGRSADGSADGSSSGGSSSDSGSGGGAGGGGGAASQALTGSGVALTPTVVTDAEDNLVDLLDVTTLGVDPPLAFIHDVVLDAKSQRSKSDLATRRRLAAEGIHLFDSYVDAATTALELDLITPEAAVAVAVAARDDLSRIKFDRSWFSSSSSSSSSSTTTTTTTAGTTAGTSTSADASASASALDPAAAALSPASRGPGVLRPALFHVPRVRRRVSSDGSTASADAASETGASGGETPTASSSSSSSSSSSASSSSPRRGAEDEDEDEREDASSASASSASASEGGGGVDVDVDGDGVPDVESQTEPWLVPHPSVLRYGFAFDALLASEGRERLRVEYARRLAEVGAGVGVTSHEAEAALALGLHPDGAESRTLGPSTPVAAQAEEVPDAYAATPAFRTRLTTPLLPRGFGYYEESEHRAREDAIEASIAAQSRAGWFGRTTSPSTAELQATRRIAEFESAAERLLALLFATAPPAVWSEARDTILRAT